MRKFYSILAVVATTITANAQNLVPNPGFETWEDALKSPEDWYASAGAQSTNTVKSGNYAMAVTSKSSTSSIGAKDITVEPGKTYVYSGWYLDNTDKAAFRYWGQWRNSSGLLDNEKSLQTNSDLEEGAEWKQFSVEAVAPSEATIARLSLRVYKQNSTTGGVIYLDDISFVDKASLSTNEVKIDLNEAVKFNSVVEDDLVINTTEKVTVNVYSLDGKLISSNRVSNGQRISFANVGVGTYIVTVDNGLSKISKKVIKR